MQSDIRFSVYEHTLVIKDNQLISRKFIVLKDNAKHIVAWTDFHQYIRSGKNRLSCNFSDDGNMRFYSVCSFLNYAFFNKYAIKHLLDVDAQIVKDFLIDYDCVLIGKLQIQGFSEPMKPKKSNMSYHITRNAAQRRLRAAFLRG